MWVLRCTDRHGDGIGSRLRDRSVVEPVRIDVACGVAAPLNAIHFPGGNGIGSTLNRDLKLLLRHHVDRHGGRGNGDADVGDWIGAGGR